MLLAGRHYEQAKRHFETARVLQPKRAAVYDGLARTLIESGADPAKGIEYAEQSLALNPYQAPRYALATLGKGYIATGQDAKAAQAALKLAKAHAVWQEYQPALDAYSRALGLRPELKEQLELDEYREALNPVIKKLTKMKDWHALAIAYEQALQVGFRDSEVNAVWAYNLASILIKRGLDIAKGIAYARRSQELNPQQPAILAVNTLARGYVKQGRYDEAIAIFEDTLNKVSSTEDKKALKRTLKRAHAAKKAAAENESSVQESTTQPKVTP